MAKILYCGDVGIQTGFGRVAEYLIPALSKKHEVHAMAVNWHGDPSPMQKHCLMYPAMAGGTDPFGSHRLAYLVQTIKPDLIWVTNDFWVGIGSWQAVKPFQEKQGFKFYCYTPIDSYGIFPETMKQVEEWDGLGTYTKFASEELRKAGYEKPIDIIPHGVDRDKFFPIDKKEARKRLGVPEDVFIVFNGNRNQPRKRIDLTIKAFVDFAKDKPDARLWLNMGKKDMGWDIVPLFKRAARDVGYDPTGKLILSNPNFNVQNCLPIEKLNEAYCASDVGINTCIGEGWGLVNFEHAAAGVAQIVPDHTSLKEIFDGVERIECHAYETDRNYGLERPIPDPASLVSLLNRYYYDRTLLEQDAKWCYDRVCNKQFNWEVIGKQMLKIVERTLAVKKEEPSKGFGEAPVKIN